MRLHTTRKMKGGGNRSTSFRRRLKAVSSNKVRRVHAMILSKRRVLSTKSLRRRKLARKGGSLPFSEFTGLSATDIDQKKFWLETAQNALRLSTALNTAISTNSCTILDEVNASVNTLHDRLSGEYEKINKGKEEPLKSLKEEWAKMDTECLHLQMLIFLIATRALQQQQNKQSMYFSKTDLSDSYNYIMTLIYKKKYGSYYYRCVENNTPEPGVSFSQSWNEVNQIVILKPVCFSYKTGMIEDNGDSDIMDSLQVDLPFGKYLNSPFVVANGSTGKWAVGVGNAFSLRKDDYDYSKPEVLRVSDVLKDSSVDFDQISIDELNRLAKVYLTKMVNSKVDDFKAKQRKLWIDVNKFENEYLRKGGHDSLTITLQANDGWWLSVRPNMLTREIKKSSGCTYPRRLYENDKLFEALSNIKSEDQNTANKHALIAELTYESYFACSVARGAAHNIYTLTLALLNLAGCINLQTIIESDQLTDLRVFKKGVLHDLEMCLANGKVGWIAKFPSLIAAKKATAAIDATAATAVRRSKSKNESRSRRRSRSRSRSRSREGQEQGRKSKNESRSTSKSKNESRGRSRSRSRSREGQEQGSKSKNESRGRSRSRSRSRSKSS